MESVCICGCHLPLPATRQSIGGEGESQMFSYLLCLLAIQISMFLQFNFCNPKLNHILLYFLPSFTSIDFSEKIIRNVLGPKKSIQNIPGLHIFFALHIYYTMEKGLGPNFKWNPTFARFEKVLLYISFLSLICICPHSQLCILHVDQL